VTKTTQTDSSESGIRAARILVVEDDSSCCEALEKVLASRGFWVVTALDGSEGLRLASNANFDVVLCNWHMPAMDGGEFYREVERVDPELCRRFIFTTGFLGPSAQQFVRQINGTLLTKPFGWSALLDAVSGLLARESSRVREHSQ
jgi:DNA-binding response OmpR family regulator